MTLDLLFPYSRTIAQGMEPGNSFSQPTEGLGLVASPPETGWAIQQGPWATNHRVRDRIGSGTNHILESPIQTGNAHGATGVRPLFHGRGSDRAHPPPPEVSRTTNHRLVLSTLLSTDSMRL